MFKRWLLILAAFLAAGALAAPAVIGVGLEHAHPWVLRRAEHRLPQVDIDVQSYQRGYFSSRMNLRLTPARGMPLAMAVDFRQGPWTGAAEWLRADWRLIHPSLGEVASGQAGIGWIGALAGHAEWSLPEAEGRLRARGRLGGDTVSVSMDGLRLAMPEWHLEGAMGEFTLTRLDPRRRHLAGRLQAGELRGPGVSLANPLVELTGGSRGHDLEWALQLSAEEAALGPERLDGLQLSLEMQRLHRPTLNALLRTIRLRARSGLRGEDFMRQVQSDLTLAVPGLLANQPALTLHHLRGLSEGLSAEVKGRIELVRTPAPGFLADSGRLLEVLRLALDVRLPQGLLERSVRAWAASQVPPGSPPAEVDRWAGDWMARLRGNRVIQTESDFYLTTVSYADQQLVLNGQPMMLPSF